MMVVETTRGSISFRIGSTPRTSMASISSRMRRAPRSAVMAVPTTPATTMASTKGANSRMRGEHEEPAEAVRHAEEREDVAALETGSAEAEAR